MSQQVKDRIEGFEKQISQTTEKVHLKLAISTAAGVGTLLEESRVTGVTVQSIDGKMQSMDGKMDLILVQTAAQNGQCSQALDRREEAESPALQPRQHRQCV